MVSLFLSLFTGTSRRWNIYFLHMKKRKPKKQVAVYRNPARYRLDFIKENTYNRVWSVRMTRARVILATVALFAGIAALLYVIFAFTPMRQLFPGALRGDLRIQYTEAALRLDSLEQAARRNDVYITNLLNIMRGDEPAAVVGAAPAVVGSDSLLAASEAEMEFVRNYEENERFNLSVLTPIAAEGMVFNSPVASGIADCPAAGLKGVAIETDVATPVMSIYRGTVVGLNTDYNGLTTVTVQHSNDFVSVYSGLGDVFVEKGARVEGGQRLGHSPRNGRVIFELWHTGLAIDPREYISI